MKNLSIEEKAKRYDEAIEKAEKWHNAPNVDKIPTFGNRIIEDAKDGDVLCTYECDKPKIVFILKGTPKKHRALSYYCYYNIMYPYFEPNSKTGCLAPNEEDVKPATKEQRDYLFARMTEEGYRWDADKKELVEQMTDEEHKQCMLEHQDETIYDMSFEEAQDYVSKRGFDIPWNDGDVMVDERKVTQTVANVLKWADRHPLILPNKKK